MEIKKVKITKIGNSYYLRIPKQFVNHGVLDLNSKYNLDLKKEVSKNESTYNNIARSRDPSESERLKTEFIKNHK